LKNTRWPALIFVFSIYVLHALLFGSWIVDDAGITFSYARNLAQGHGLVSQPGAEPVEGYSNFLWLVLIAAFFIFNAFHPVIVPKALSFLFVFLFFLLMEKTLRLFYKDKAWPAYVIPFMLAINTSFVVWTTSGLENPLYALVVLLIFYLCLKSLKQEASLKRLAALGLAAAAAALTRPDGVMFFAAYPVLLLLSRFSGARLPTKKDLAGLLAYASPFVIVFGGYLIFRALYFHDLYPNTYYAKGGPELDDLLEIHLMKIWTYGSFYSLMESAAGSFGVLSLLIGFVMALKLHYSKGLKAPLAAAGFFLYLSILTYLLLPDDWMPEHRFATPVYPFYYLFGISVFAGLLEKVKSARLKCWLVLAAGILFMGGSARMFAERSIEFARSPVVPFSRICKSFGRGISEYAGRLGVEDGSVLLPDVGGSLYCSELRVYDLGGLCDRTIARTMRKDQQAFYDYVFNQIKPTFILTHHSWTYKAAFDLDPRFRKDYVPVNEYKDQWIKKHYGLNMHSGLYVRKEAIKEKAQTFRQIQEEYREKYVFE